MPNNPYCNKVEFNNVTLIDLTNDTVTSSSLEIGETAHSRSGSVITGTLVKAIPIDVNTDAGMSAVLIADNVGKCYRFTGTTGTYINGDLYVVEVNN